MNRVTSLDLPGAGANGGRPYAGRRGPRSSGWVRAAGFTLIELMITVVIISIISAVAYPSYIQYVVRASRQAAQSEMTNMVNLQEKIYLNSNAYAGSITAAYDGTSTGGLGVTSGLSGDGKYTYTILPTAPGQTYVITATPDPAGAQAADGNLSISSTGAKTWGAKTSW
jgi:type IV pilus assembly protein PilE